MPKTRLVTDPHSFSFRPPMGFVALDASGKWVDALKAWLSYRRKEKLAECKAKVEAWFAASMGMTVSEWRQAQRKAEQRKWLEEFDKAYDLALQMPAASGYQPNASPCTPPPGKD